jgi:hypothetical protein
METVPRETCLSLLVISGAKYRGGFVGALAIEAMYESNDSPPVPDAVGSPV